MQRWQYLHSHQTMTPITVIAARSLTAGRGRNGSVVAPAPVDYVAWTARIMELARYPDLKAPERGMWLTG